MSKRDDQPTERNTVIFTTWDQEEYSDATKWKTGVQQDGVKKWGWEYEVERSGLWTEQEHKQDQM